jgi:hypothetical protein
MSPKPAITGLISLLFSVLIFYMPFAPETRADSNEMYSVQNMQLTHMVSKRSKILKNLFNAYPHFAQTKWYDLVKNDGTHLIRFVAVLDTSKLDEQLGRYFGQPVQRVRWRFEYPFSCKLNPKDVMCALEAIKIVPTSTYIVTLQDGSTKQAQTNAKGELLRIFHESPVSFYADFQTENPPPLLEGGLDVAIPMK